MKILIVEDEKPAADRIILQLKKISNTLTAEAVTETVEETINWLQSNPLPDLILMDIQLDDGLCFEIFETIQVDVPVIFITAYNEYALQAFKVNSVDYLLKPVDESLLKNAIEKYQRYHSKESDMNALATKLLAEINKQFKTRFLVKVGLHYKSILVNDICCFYIVERSTFIKTMNGRNYSIEFSLDRLQKMVDPATFYRINRNYLIHIDAITEIESFSSNRLLVKLINQEPNLDLIVSRDNVSEFKSWIDR